MKLVIKDKEVEPVVEFSLTINQFGSVEVRANGKVVGTFAQDEGLLSFVLAANADGTIFNKSARGEVEVI